jgi:hypothetical protein
MKWSASLEWFATDYPGSFESARLWRYSSVQANPNNYSTGPALESF